ncbi:hypothetical protein DRQ53_15950 [bacterium]|nr:MAG: hypothetical protein DRQ53_15950 [bacterium]RKZ13970.1 MAG: hypothetical protein DRQ32_00385 [bacterium]
MPRSILAATVPMLVLLIAAPAVAQLYPSSGQVYLSFHPHVQQSTREVLPGETFQLWIAVDIPVNSANPQIGIVGVEGGVSLPPSLELVETAFQPPAINVGASYREPGLESFVVGLGECVSLGPRRTLGSMTLRLVTPGSDIEIDVTAPAVGAAAVSSFAGIGPGWAAQDCMSSDGFELLLFDAPVAQSGTIVVNPVSVPTDTTGFSLIKSRFGS